MINDIVKLFDTRIKERGLTLEKDIENIDIRADRFKIEQVFINLIDNAIKYTDRGTIKISSRISNNNLEIIIEDTGIGIPANDISRIFERFYVVDKSRSRKLGGTGLGLSIVKHIIQLHNGKISIDSSKDTGTKITLTIPRNPQ